MSFDDYAHHIYQKYRLNVAIAILKTKPQNITSMEYLAQLQSKMADKMVVDDDVTICSDDFMMNDDSDTILIDFDDEIIGDEINDDRVQENGDQNNIDEDLTQATFYNNSQSQTHIAPIEIEAIDNNLTQYKTEDNTCSQSIIKDSRESINNNKYSELNNPLKLNTNSMPNNTENINKTQVECSNNNELKLTANSAYDSQKTIIYSLHGFTQNYTHYSPSQNEIVIPNKYLYSANKNSNTNVTNDSNNKVTKVTCDTKTKEVTNVDTSKPPNTEIVIPKIAVEYNDNNKEVTSNVTNINLQNETYFTNSVSKESCVTYSQNLNNQNKNDYTNSVCKDNCVAYSQNENNKNKNTLSQNVNVFSQNQNDFTNSVYKDNCVIYSQNENNQNKNTLSQNVNVFSQNQNNFDNSESILKPHHLDNSQNIDNYFNEIHNLNNTTILNETNFDTPNEIDKITQHIIEFSQNNEIQSFDFNKNLHINKEYATNKNISQNLQPNNTFSQNLETNHTFSQNIETIDEETDTNELISYKVLEELNKIKAFLRRKDRRVSSDGFSSDSGYRSDSQFRSSNRSALQLSGASINQSAYCLLNFTMQCSLISATRDITQEIAQTLGQLIDKLHEEESYPPFLEEILDGVDILLRQIYKGHTNINSEFLEKDEYMQRILLLNKSIQIQKHSIDKITEILTQFYENIADKNVTYELTNIDEVENISYIFHILENLLKKYIKNKNTESQINSQLSQEDEKILNKSAITDIWRQKWNPNLKKDSEGSRENRCVLKKCSEILNKIVVDCVDSYSLVAFSALKCFNSMQN